MVLAPPRKVTEKRGETDSEFSFTNTVFKVLRRPHEMFISRWIYRFQPIN